MFDVTLMPVNGIDQMLAHVFAGRNASDLVCGVGQRGLELGTVLALTSQVRWASPIGRWHRMLDGGRFELLANEGQPGHQLWMNRAELLLRPRYQRFQAGDLAIVQAEFVRRFLDELNHVRQVFVTTACRKRLEQQRERRFGNGSFPAQAGRVVRRSRRTRFTEALYRQRTQFVGERQLVRVRRLIAAEG